MRSSFFVLQPLFARKHRVKPGKKPPLCIRVHRKAPSWTGSSRSASLVASHGNISLRCIPEGGSDRKNALSWQDIAALLPKGAGFGQICSPCIQNALQSAVWEYISRVSCHQDALFPSESLKSCTMGKYCHAFSTRLSCGSFAIPVCVGAWCTTSVEVRPSLRY